MNGTKLNYKVHGLLHLLLIPQTSAFSVVAPTLWNSLPVNIRCCSSFQSFKNLLKHIYTTKSVPDLIPRDHFHLSALYIVFCFVFMHLGIVSLDYGAL